MKETIFIQLKKCTKVQENRITIKDVASVTCNNNDITNKVKSLCLFKAKDSSVSRIVISIILLLEVINKNIPNAEIVPLGESDCIVKFEKNKGISKPVIFLKVAAVCFIVFFGSAFSIMAFNNDVESLMLFNEIYSKLTGKESDGFTILEVSYSIGIALGILIFYNHFGKKKFSSDPTPIEIEMRLYEDEINTSIIDGDNREMETEN